MNFILILVIAIISFLFPIRPARAQSVVNIDGNIFHQRVDGFGASTAFQTVNITHLSSTLQTNLYDLLFSTSNGIGLSIVRNEMHPNILPRTGSYDWNQADDAALRPILQAAKNRGVNIFYWVPWTPPAWMKDNNSITNGGQLLPQYYQAYADMISTYIRQYKNQYGIDTYAFSIQNEPDYTATYRSARWSSQQIHDFIKNNLYPTLNRDGISTRIMAAEHTGWQEAEAQQTLTDPQTSYMLSIVAAHKYSGSYTPFPDATNLNKSVWQTEHSNLNANDTSMGDGLRWAREIFTAFTSGNVNAWFYWWLAANDSTGQQLVNFTTSALSPNKRFYTVGNFSKFVRPGYYRIDAPIAPATNINLTAFRAPNTNAVVLVAINNGTVDSPLTFSLTNVNVSSVTPFITSATQNLQAQSAVNVSNGQFSYTLPASSVVSFVSPDALTPLNIPTPTPPPFVTPGPSPTPGPSLTPGPTSTGVPKQTATPTQSPTPIVLVGDINHDGIVNILDYTLLSNAFGSNNSSCDLNADGIVNILDYTLLSNNFGRTG